MTNSVERRVLVTGANGFIGSHCLEPLLRRGYEVHAVSRGRPDGPAGITWHECDLLALGAAERLVERVGPSHLLHLAWYVVPGQVISSPVNHRWVARSVELLQAFARQDGRRAVVSGSAYEYDWGAGRCDEETTPLAPSTVYGACKAALFLQATAIAREAGVSLAWIRPFFLYGPREHPDRLVASVARALLRGLPATTSHGRQRRDYLHVQDVANAAVATLDSDLTGAANVGAGEAVALREIVTRIGDIVGRPDLLRIGEIPARSNDVPLVVAGGNRLARELGWRPRFDLDAGLLHTIDWWRHELLAEEAPR